MQDESIQLLLADDDQDDCLLFREALEELQLSVNLTIVNDGEQLMNFLSLAKQELPALLFLDLNMPRKNGLECLTEIRQLQQLVHLPVIIYSTSFEPEIVEMLFDKGAQYYIRKPAEFARLKEVIYNAILLATQPTAMPPDKDQFVLNA